MKKILLFIVMAMFAIPSMAQIQISTQKSKAEIVTKFRGGTQALAHSEHSGYSLWLKTDNQFDEVFTINLGDDEDAAIESIDGLLYLINNSKKGDTTAFNDNAGVETFVTFDIFMGGKVLWFARDSYAGNSSITSKELEKLKKDITARKKE